MMKGVNRYIFWVHGASVIPENTKEYTGEDNGLYLNRTAFGAQVRQNPNTHNWFHFAVPSASYLDDEIVMRKRVFLRFRVNKEASIDRVTVRENWLRNSGHGDPLIDEDRLDIVSRDMEFYRNIPYTQCGGPIVISVYVSFIHPGGEVWFTGAGVELEETFNNKTPSAL
jgi:hypothetical protein